MERTKVPIRNELVSQLTRWNGMRENIIRCLPTRSQRAKTTSFFVQLWICWQCGQVNLGVFTLAPAQSCSSMVWPVTASLAVEGQRTSSRLMTGPVFTFRAAGVPKNLILSEAIDDARLVNIVRRHLEFDAIADGKSNKSFAHFSGNVRQD